MALRKVVTAGDSGCTRSSIRCSSRCRRCTARSAVAPSARKPSTLCCEARSMSSSMSRPSTGSSRRARRSRWPLASICTQHLAQAMEAPRPLVVAIGLLGRAGQRPERKKDGVSARLQLAGGDRQEESAPAEAGAGQSLAGQHQQQAGDFVEALREAPIGLVHGLGQGADEPGEPRVVAELPAGAEESVARARIERQARSRRTVGDDRADGLAPALQLGRDALEAMIAGQRDEVAVDIGDGLVQLGPRRHGFRHPRHRARAIGNDGEALGLGGEQAGVLREQPLQPLRHLARIARIADPEPLADQVVGPDRSRGAVANARFRRRSGWNRSWEASCSLQRDHVTGRLFLRSEDVEHELVEVAGVRRPSRSHRRRR